MHIHTLFALSWYHVAIQLFPYRAAEMLFCTSLNEVKKFWTMMKESGREVMPSKNQLYADAWGIRKLTTHTLRNLRQDRLPRALGLH